MAGLIKPTQRFSLLLLDEGEYYFEDFAGFYYPGGMDDDQAVKRRIKGRIKLCSHSLIFEPDELSKPIMKLPFRHVESVDRYYGPLLALLQNKVDMFSLKSRVWVEMKENNNNAPYLFKEEKREHRFSLTYVNLTNFLPRVINFYNIALRGDVSMASETDSELVKLMEERENSILFDRSHIEDLNEKILLESRCTRVTPLVNNPGRLLITNKIIYFMPFNNVSIKPVEKIRLEHIIRIEKRRYVLRDVGLEIFAQQEVAESMFFSFKNTDLRDSVHNTLIVQPAMSCLDSEDQSLVTLKWQNGLISNYDYLMYLNTLAGRSFNDITQYPVFPWVVADYKSESLDLKNPSTFRELSKPIGALNADRLSMFKQRMRDIPSDHPKFLYGTHYSTPGYVLFYLVRSAPEYMLRLQNGKYDSASRLFHSISETWQGVLNNQADVKELIPEFYDVDRKGGFLINSEHLNFGVKDNGEVVDNVVLPAWAKDSEDFVKQLRNALESDYIGDKLHQWIDLIFGYKQRGQEAVKSDNLFYYLTYEGAVDLDNIRDPHERRAIIAQIKEFGQTPKQLMKTPHPPKLPKSERVSDVSQLITPNEPKTVATQSNVGWNLDEVTSLESEFSFKLHKDIITSMALSRDNKTLFSVSQDASLKIYSLPEKRQMRSVNLCELALSSLKLTPDEKTVIVGSWDNNVYLYSIDYGRVLDTIAAHDDSVSCVCYNPLKPDLLVSSSWDASVKMWRISGTNVNKLPIGEFVDHDAEVHCIDIDSSATTAVAGSVDGTVFFYDLVSKSAIRSVELHTDVVTCVQFTPEGNRAVTCSSDGYVKIVDISGSQVFSMNLGCPLKALKTDGQVILVGGEDGILSIIDIKSNAIVKQIKGQEGITSIVCSSSCDLVVVGCSGGSIRVLVTRKSGSNSN